MQTACLPLSFSTGSEGFSFVFFVFYIFEKDTGMCLLQQCHLARTSPEELGVFRNVDMATGSSLTRAPLLVSSTPKNRFGTGLP